MRTYLTIAIMVGVFAGIIITRSGAQSANINATANVNICGNAVVETPAEDCEGADLNGASCTSLGYASGTLTCDVACSFDVSACVAASPSPSPSPSASAAASSTPSPSISPTPTPSPSPSPSPTRPSPSRRPSPRPSSLPLVVDSASKLPQSLIALLKDAGHTDTTTITPSIMLDLVDRWALLSRRTPRTVCDLNGDTHCDAVDLSIIFFYTGRGE